MKMLCINGMTYKKMIALVNFTHFFLPKNDAKSGLERHSKKGYFSSVNGLRYIITLYIFSSGENSFGNIRQIGVI
jgi:hypothetical protein